jgi:predicted permease
MSGSLGCKIYRILLKLLPAQMRSEHGAEMEELFLEALEACRRRGRAALLLGWFRGTADVVIVSVRRRNRKAGVEPSTANVGSSLVGWFGNLGQDFKVATRGLVKSRSFSIIALLSLALGIGANTALFTMVHASRLAQVPGVNGPDRVVELLVSQGGGEMQAWTYPDFERVRDVETPIESLAGWKARDGSLTTEQGVEQIRLMYVSADYFRVLGVVPSRGRDFVPAEDTGPGQHAVVIVSHALWQGRLEGDHDIVGRTITLNRTLHTVVGVAPEEFSGHHPNFGKTDLWLPLMQERFVSGASPLTEDRDVHWLSVLGRLRVDATRGEANAALRTVFGRLANEFPESNEGRTARAAAFGPFPAQARTGDTAAMIGLMALAGFVLLIICGNLAGMGLARSATRAKEIGVRLALGAGRGRVIRLLMCEAFVLAIAGGGLGILLASWGTSAAATSGLASMLPDTDLKPNLVVLSFSLVVTLGTAIVFGLLPALRLTRPELASSLKDDVGAGSPHIGRVHKLAVAAQTGIALFLLIVSSLFLRAVGTFEEKDLGFQPQGLVVTSLNADRKGYESREDVEIFLARVREAVGAISGVQSVALADGIPLDLDGGRTTISASKRVDGAGGGVLAEITSAQDGYFQTIGTPVLRGRGFESTDTASSETVAVITKALADQLWPGEEALGRELHVALHNDDNEFHTVVGIIGDIASSRPTENNPHVFLARGQHESRNVMVVVRATSAATALARPIQSAILAIDPEFPIPAVVGVESLLERGLGPQRGTALLAAGFGLLTLFLSAIGVYGVVAFAVASRTREIGLRMALGASRGRVLRSVISDALRLSVPGLIVGAFLAVGTGIAMRSMLLGVSPLDPMALGVATGGMLLVVLTASIIPARRASSTDPMNALRCE